MIASLKNFLAKTIFATTKITQIEKVVIIPTKRAVSLIYPFRKNPTKNAGFFCHLYAKFSVLVGVKPTFRAKPTFFGSL